jgi:hypothetical protein
MHAHAHARARTHTRTHTHTHTHTYLSPTHHHTRIHKYRQTYKVIVSIGVTEPREQENEGLEDQTLTLQRAARLSWGEVLGLRLQKT